MDRTTLSWILGDIPPAATFNILSDTVDESNYGDAVVYNDPSLKPTWSQVQSGVIPQQWTVVRGQRMRRLQASDWAALPDVPMSSDERTEWETYRQELRDITDQPDPFNITWPTPPA